MGITALWDVLGEGEVVSMATFASDHYKRTARPLTVAIDEAHWRFKNLNDHQVAAIRAKAPEANPVEKAIYWRICRLLRLNIHPIFVFDGPRRPWKRGRPGGNKIDWEKTRLLTEMLDRMRIPHHRAPGEAEAECAHMQQRGIVDAVWSDDGDSLMFGATLLIRDYRAGGVSGKKSDTLIKVYRTEVIREKYRLDQAGLICFATLVGGDYDTTGLSGCGQVLGLKLSQQEHLKRALCDARNERDLVYFRQVLENVLLELRKALPVPADFPRWLAVNHYKSPVVSSPEQIDTLRARKQWDRDIDHIKMEEFMGAKFDIWFDDFKYIKDFAPLWLIKTLLSTAPGQERINECFAIRLEKQTKKKDASSDDNDRIKISFDPASFIEMILPEEKIQKLKTRTGTFNKHQRVELETLRCIVSKGIGASVLEEKKKEIENTSARRGRGNKRKASTEDDSQHLPDSALTVAVPPYPEVKEAKNSNSKKKARMSKKKGPGMGETDRGLPSVEAAYQVSEAGTSTNSTVGNTPLSAREKVSRPRKGQTFHTNSSAGRAAAGPPLPDVWTASRGGNNQPLHIRPSMRATDTGGSYSTGLGAEDDDIVFLRDSSGTPGRLTSGLLYEIHQRSPPQTSRLSCSQSTRLQQAPICKTSAPKANRPPADVPRFHAPRRLSEIMASVDVIDLT